MNKRLVFSFLLCVFLNSVGFSQSLNGIYTNNEENRVICIKNDTLAYVYNTEGIIVPVMLLSPFVVKEKELVLQKSIIGDKTSYIEESEGEKERINFSLFHINKEPIRFAAVRFFQNDKMILYKEADEKGCISLDKEDINKFDDSLCVEIRISRGFSTTQIICLEVGKSYSINAKMIEGHIMDIPNSKYFKILINNPDELVIKRWIRINYVKSRKKWDTIIMTKTGECDSLLEIFEKWDVRK